jgi:hypothetical protein
MLCPRAVLLKLLTSIAVLDLVHIDLLLVDARLVASCPSSSLRVHLVSISCFPMDQNERTMSGDDNHAAVTTGNNPPRPRDDLLEGFRAGRKALISWLKGGSDHQAKRAEKAGIAMYKANLLDRAIELHREALKLRPPGHPNRAYSCANLGCSLFLRYNRTSDVALLDEAIELHREALALQPPDHPDRATSCANLGSSLHARYLQTGDAALLDEAIELEREALALRPPGHRYRATSCANLAVSLDTHYLQTDDAALLDEAIELEREALALQPPGHPNRAYSCANLGSSLFLRYYQTSDVALLDEAIEFDREALALRPPGHPLRASSCTNLGVSFRVHYQQTGNASLLNEAIEACIYASEHAPPSQIWYPLVLLSDLHLFCDSPHYSVLKALEYLQQSFQHEAGSIHGFILNVCRTFALMWDNSGVWTPRITALLVDVYAKMVDRLPLVAGLVLDTSSRLQSLKLTRQIGSDACVAALLAQQPATALTLIDRAHGVVWSQALRQRDPQMEGAPASLSAELEGLLSAIATRPPIDPAGLPDQHGTQDLRYRQNTRIQTILRQIRAMPGLSHFMLGSTYETLRKVARDHPVVVLVAARDHALALIMSSAEENEPHALGLALTSDDLLSLRGSAEQAGLRSRADTRDGNTDERLGIHMRKMNVNHQPLRVLADIWRKIVKPVIDHLQLEVGSDNNMDFPPIDIRQTEGHWSIAAPSSLVCQRRLCLPSDPCCWHIHGATSQPGVLLQFRRLFVHPHHPRSTPGPESSHSD